MIKAIFFDVDGTLLSHTTKRISQDTVQAVRTLQDQGIRIFMATGRHSTELDQLPVRDIRFDGYITFPLFLYDTDKCSIPCFFICSPP